MRHSNGSADANWKYTFPKALLPDIVDKRGIDMVWPCDLEPDGECETELTQEEFEIVFQQISRNASGEQVIATARGRAGAGAAPGAAPAAAPAAPAVPARADAMPPESR